MSKEYYNIDGEPVALNKLCKDEPEWAANVIRHYKDHLRLLAGAVLKYSCGYENAELEEACQVAKEYVK